MAAKKQDESGARGDVTESAASQWAGVGDPSRLQQIIEAIPNMVFLKDATDLRFVGLNRAGEELLGYDREELLGKSDFDFFTAEEAEFFVQKDREVLEGGELVDIAEEPIHTRHRGERLLHTKKVPILGSDGRPLYLLGISEDITELKRTQEELQQAQEQLMASRLRESQKMEQLGILAGGIAHDFNNLLVGILGNVSLALGEVEEGGELHAMLGKISLAAEGAARLTGQMLAYSGRSRFVLESVELGTLVEELSDLLSTSIPKSARLKLSLASGLTIQADTSQVRQLVMNLITNAADALDGGAGDIKVELNAQVLDGTLEARPWDVGVDAGGPHACLVVSDSGVGMDESTLSRMFDPFFSTKDTGHGLGLSATVGIVNAHGGLLRVSSSPGDGTRFFVAFPLAEGGGARAVEEKQSDGRIPTGTRVLIVDDEEIVRDFSLLALTREGLDCKAADSGEAALRLLREQPDAIDFILLDLSMPGMGGKACLAEIRTIRPDVPVLLSSGFDERNSPLVAEANTAFLAKPHGKKELLASASRLIAASRRA